MVELILLRGVFHKLKSLPLKSSIRADSETNGRVFNRNPGLIQLSASVRGCWFDSLALCAISASFASRRRVLPAGPPRGADKGAGIAQRNQTITLLRSARCFC